MSTDSGANRSHLDPFGIEADSAEIFVRGMTIASGGEDVDGFFGEHSEKIRAWGLTEEGQATIRFAAKVSGLQFHSEPQIQ